LEDGRNQKSEKEEMVYPQISQIYTDFQKAECKHSVEVDLFVRKQESLGGQKRP